MNIIITQNQIREDGKIAKVQRVEILIAHLAGVTPPYIAYLNNGIRGINPEAPLTEERIRDIKEVFENHYLEGKIRKRFFTIENLDWMILGEADNDEEGEHWGNHTWE